MKTVLTAVAALVSIILIRMAVSFGISEPAAEVFTQVSLSILFFMCLFQSVSRRRAAAK
ncbi:MAG: hypothetical protein HFF89_01000 [Oscillibacter sp.]|nr:hypothetical protein [Oscillibacter sp.]MCI8688922.1 hypothetical protein [Oscillibacter sp.]MCI8847662.1 hypothetical protein [Oscillibacter sp.]MCI9374946.1 hypothetical protein [Oscillibacter sp.]MCI9481904.1 hypothetical protein [Oscillibacter sp.]